MALAAPVVAHLLGITFMFALAGWLLWLNFESRVNRAFALFLFLRGMLSLCNRMMAFDAPDAGLWLDVSYYFSLALVPALAYFLVVYLDLRPAWRRFLTGAVIVFAALVEAAYLRDHCLVRCEIEGGIHYGPLSLLTFGLTPAYAVAGIAFARQAFARPGEPRSEGAFLVSAAFLLEALVDSGVVVGLLGAIGWEGIFSRMEPSAWVYASYLLRASAMPLAILGVILLARAPAGGGRAGGAWALGGLAAAAAATGAFLGTAVVLPASEPLSSTLVALWRMLLPAVIVYAILRHRLFDLDVKVKWTLSKVPLGAAVVGAFFLPVQVAEGGHLGGDTVSALSGVVLGSLLTWLLLSSDGMQRWWSPPKMLAMAVLVGFFVTTQIAESYLSTAYGAIVGGLATGLVLFFLSPLQRLGERLANGVMPGTKPISAMSHPERLEFYRTHATLAWADGVLSSKERILLDHLRARLGLTMEEAAHLELAALDARVNPRASPSS